MGNALSSEKIKENLLNPKWEIEVLECVDSTNTLAKQKAENGAPEFSLFVANEQTKGKGRKGRAFFSPKSEGVYFSFILRPNIKVQQAVKMTCAAGVAVCRAIKALTGKNAGIKWVNDVFIDGKKVCGILTEAATDYKSGFLEYAVVGIGINTGKAQYPEEIRAIADSIGEVDRNVLVALIINNFEELFEKGCMQEYKNLSIVLGKKITVLKKEGNEEMTAVDIDENGHLAALDSAGNIHLLSSGEISVRLV